VAQRFALHIPCVLSASATVDIRVRQQGGKWTAPSSYGYINEAELQQILFDQPSLIEGVSSRAIPVRELTMSVGRADVVMVDTDGTITIVECKLATGPDIRRTIVGQVLDYAARLAELTPTVFAEHWQRRGGQPLDQFFDGQPEESRRAFEANLEAGVFTLVLAVDSINTDLRRIVRVPQHAHVGRDAPAGHRVCGARNTAGRRSSCRPSMGPSRPTRRTHAEEQGSAPGGLLPTSTPGCASAMSSWPTR